MHHSALRLIKKILAVVLALTLSNPIAMATFVPIRVEEEGSGTGVTNIRKIQVRQGKIVDQNNGNALLVINGDLSSATTIPDNALVRGDGGAKGIQGSNIYIDDSDNITAINNLTANGLTINATASFAGTTFDVNSSAVSFADTDISLDGASTTFTQTTGAITLAPAAGSNVNLTLSGAGDFAVATNKLYVDTSASKVGINNASPSTALDVTGTINATAQVNGVTANFTTGNITTVNSTTVNSSVVNGATFDGNFTNGSILFSNAAGIVSQSNTQLYWDRSNNRLGLADNKPTALLDVGNGTATYIDGTKDALIADDLEVNDTIWATTINGGTGYYDTLYADVISGEVHVDNGSATNPSHSFTGDTNTGMYLDDFDRLAFTTGGTERLLINSSGNVGLGVTNPTSFKLQTAGNIGPNADSTYDLGSSTLRFANTYSDNFNGSTANVSSVTSGTFHNTGNAVINGTLAVNGKTNVGKLVSSTNVNGTYAVFTGTADISGTTNVGKLLSASEVNGTYAHFANFQMTSGAAANYILRSDGSGHATWIDPSVALTNGDVFLNALNDAISDKDSNLFLGNGSGLNNAGEYNTAVGILAMGEITSGNGNTALGYRAGNPNTSGNYNVALGSFTLNGNDMGAGNIALGHQAAFTTNGDYNTALGFQSGKLISSGDKNITLGYKAGDNITTGSSNIIIGDNLDAPSATASNQMYLGGILFGDTSTGNIGLGDVTPVARLDVGGATATFIDGTDDLIVKDDIEADGDIYTTNFTATATINGADLVVDNAVVNQTARANKVLVTTNINGADLFISNDSIISGDETVSGTSSVGRLLSAANINGTYAVFSGNVNAAKILASANINGTNATFSGTGNISGTTTVGKLLSGAEVNGTVANFSSNANIAGVVNGGTFDGDFTNGSILFSNATGTVSQSNAQLYWDRSNNRLGLADNKPASLLDVGNGDITHIDGVKDVLIADDLEVDDTIWATTINGDVGHFGTLYADIISGEIQVTNGSAANPSHSFTADPNTGMYLDDFDRLGFTTAGTERLLINSAGNIGIGVTNPTNFKLEVNGNIGPSADSTHSLGTSAIRFANTYSDNFNGAAASINSITSGALNNTGNASIGGTLGVTSTATVGRLLSGANINGTYAVFSGNINAAKILASANVNGTNATFSGTGNISGTTTVGKLLSGSEVNGTYAHFANLQMTTGAAANYILRSDGAGNATWIDPTVALTNGSVFINALNDAISDKTSNLFLGNGSGLTNAGEYNTAVGILAMGANTSGNGNTALGYRAGNPNTTGNYNVALGSFTLNSNDLGAGNIALGHEAAFTTNGDYNTALGFQSGKLISTGDKNITLGYKAGDNLTTGSSNIIIGDNLDAPSATASNQMYLGGILFGDTSTGNIGLGDVTPVARLDVGGAAATFIDGTDDLIVKDDIEADGDIYTTNFTATATINGSDLVITDDATILGDTAITGNTTIGGTLGVTNTATVGRLLSGANVNGTYAVFSGNINAAKILASANVNGTNATFSGNGSFGGTLGVTNTATVGKLLSGAEVNGTVANFSSNANIAGVVNGGTFDGDFTNGSILFSNATGTISQSNTQLYWDRSNNRLGLADNKPTALLDVGNGTAAYIDGVKDVLIADDLEVNDSIWAATINGNVGHFDTLYADIISGEIQVTNGSAASPSHSFTADLDTGMYLDDFNRLGFSTNGTEQLLINPNGNVGIGVTNPNTFKLEVNGNIGPSADSTHSLGSSSVRFANTYSDNFNGATANINSITSGALNNTGNTTIGGTLGVTNTATVGRLLSAANVNGTYAVFSGNINAAKILASANVNGTNATFSGTGNISGRTTVGQLISAAEVNGTAAHFSSLQVSTGATNNFILASDSAGNATWTDPAVVLANGGVFINALNDAISDKSSNLFLGNGSGLSNSGEYNTAVGILAMGENTSGNGNTALGYKAGNPNTSGNFNVALGSYTLNSNDLGAGNIALGHEAAFTTNGDYNTALGFQSGKLISTGDKNITLGYKAGDNLTTGSSNIIIGDNLDAPSATASNQMYLGGILFGDTSTGNIGLGDVTPVARLDVGGGSATFIDGTDDLIVKDDIEADGDIYTTNFTATATINGSTLVVDNATVNQTLGANKVLVTTNINGADLFISNDSTISGDLNVTGNANVGRLLSGANVNGTYAVFSGNVNAAKILASANVNGTVANFTTANVSGTTNTGKLLATGSVNGNTANFTTGNITTVNSTTIANSGNASVGRLLSAANVNGTYAVFSGNINAAKILASANVNGTNATFSGTGNISGRTTVGQLISAAEVNGTAAHFSSLQVSTGATNNFILASDSAGNATWTDPAVVLANGGVFINALNDAISDKSSNLFLGNGSGLSNSGEYNTAVGILAMGENTSGNGNTALGYKAGNPNTSGNFNVALGSYTLNSNDLGAGNIALGHEAAFTTNGDYNTALGFQSGKLISTGDKNITLGYKAGDNLTTGSSNIIIGDNLDAPSATASNQMYLGGILFGDTSTGNIGLGDVTPVARLDVGGGSATFIDGTDDLIVKDDIEADGDIYTTNFTATATINGSTLVVDNATVNQTLGANKVLVTTNINGADLFISNDSTISGDLNVTGNANVDRLLSGANVNGTYAVFSGNVNAAKILASANVNGTVANFTTANVSGTTNTGKLLATGSVNGNTANFTTGNITTVNSTTIANSGNASVGRLLSAANVNGTYAVFSGNINAAKILASANVNGTNATFSGTGNISGRTTVGQLISAAEVNGTAAHFSSLQVSTGATNNFILASDSAGNATWTDPAVVLANGGVFINALNDAISDKSSNLFLGNGSGLSNSGEYNTAVGILAMGENTSGNGNTALGYKAGNPNTSGNFNVALGSYTLNSNDLGAGNIALGHEAAFTTNGDYNTALGFQSGKLISTGDKNITLGYKAGDNLTTGSSNIIIGDNLDAPSATASNQMYLGGILFGDTSTGNIGLGDVTPVARLDVGGGSATFIDGTDDLIVKDDIEADGDIYTTNFTATATINGSTLVVDNATVNQTLGANKVLVTTNINGADLFISNDSTISGDLNVTGNANVGRLLSSANVNGTYAVFSGNVNAAKILASANVNGTVANFTTANVSGTTNTGKLLATGSVNGNTANFTTGNITTVNSTTIANSGNASVGRLLSAANVNGTYAVFSGNINAAKILASANVNGTNATFSGTGNISGRTTVGQLISAAEVNGTAAHFSSLQVSTGATNNFILASDSAGNATWTDPAVVLANGGVFINALNDAISDKSSNLFLGNGSGLSNSGEYNTAVGILAMGENTSGNGNTALGYKAGNPNTSGNFNVALGSYTLNSNDLGAGNIALGHEAAFTTNGDYNTALGFQSGKLISTGDKNITLGYKAGDNLTTGSSNIIIGDNLDAPSATASNQMYLGGILFGDTSTGNIGLGDVTPVARLDVGGGSIDFIDGTDDLIVKDDVEVDGDIYSTNITASGIINGSTLIGDNITTNQTLRANKLLVTTNINGASLNISGASVIGGNETVTGTSSVGRLLSAANINGTYAVFSGNVNAAKILASANVNGTNANFNGTLNAAGNTTLGANLTVDTSTLYVNSATNKVGIGTTAPGANLTVNGSAAFIPSANVDIDAATGITVTNSIMRIQGDGGAADLSADPQIADGVHGQIVILKGLSDTNTIKFHDGEGLSLISGVPFTLGDKDSITFMYDSVDDQWVEISRSNR